MLFSECMKLTPAWSLRRATATRWATCKWLLDALSHGSAPNVEELALKSLKLDAAALEAWHRGKRNKAWTQIKKLQLTLHIPSEQDAKGFADMLSEANRRDEYIGGNGLSGGSGRRAEATFGGNSCNNSDDSFFPELRHLVFQGAPIYGGVVWRALMEKACPRLETVRSTLTYEALKDMALPLETSSGGGGTAVPLIAASSSFSSSSSSSTAVASSFSSPPAATPSLSPSYPSSSKPASPPLNTIENRAATTLVFSKGSLKQENLDYFAALMQHGRLPSIEVLYFEGVFTIADVAATFTSICQALPALPQLHTLCLPGMTDESVTALAQALSNGALPRLEKLILSSIPMGGTAVNQPLLIQDSAFLPFTAALAEGAGTMLKKLDIRSLCMSENALGALACVLSSTACPYLRTLRVPIGHVGKQSGTQLWSVLQASPKGRRIRLV